MENLLIELYKKNPVLAEKVGVHYAEANLGKKFFNVFLGLFNKLSKDKQQKFKDKAIEYTKKLSKIVKNSINNTQVKPLLEKALKEAENKGYLDKSRGKNQNYSKVGALIRNSLKEGLKSEKIKIKNNLLTLDKQTASIETANLLEKIKRFSVGASFSLVFGLIDNLGLFIGMGALEDTLMKMGYDSIVAAGLGNTFSDALGALAGGWVSAMLYKILKVKGEGTISQQVIGVTVGCLIPVFIKMIAILLTGTASVEKIK